MGTLMVFDSLPSISDVYELAKGAVNSTVDAVTSAPEKLLNNVAEVRLINLIDKRWDSLAAGALNGHWFALGVLVFCLAMVWVMRFAMKGVIGDWRDAQVVVINEDFARRDRNERIRGQEMRIVARDFVHQVRRLRGGAFFELPAA